MTHPPSHPTSIDTLICRAQQRAKRTPSTQDTTSISTLTSEDQARAATPPVRRRGRRPKSPPRPHQVATTLSDAEYETYMAQVGAAGLTRAEYARLLITQPGRITLRALTDIDAETLAVLLQCAACLTEMRDSVRAISASSPTLEDILVLRQHHEQLRQLAKTIYAIVEGIYGDH